MLVHLRISNVLRRLRVIKPNASTPSIQNLHTEILNNLLIPRKTAGYSKPACTKTRLVQAAFGGWQEATPLILCLSKTRRAASAAASLAVGLPDAMMRANSCVISCATFALAWFRSWSAREADGCTDVRESLPAMRSLFATALVTPVNKNKKAVSCNETKSSQDI